MIDIVIKRIDKKFFFYKGNDQVVLLNPRNLNNGYYIETGWATNSENIDVPNSKTLWEVVGNNKLTPNNPVNLKWKNDQGIIFEKKISIDDEYLFTVDQSIKNANLMQHVIKTIAIPKLPEILKK